LKSLKCYFGVHLWSYGSDLQSKLPSRFCNRCSIYQNAVINEDWYMDGQPVLKWRWADDQDSISDFVKGEMPWADLFETQILRSRKDELMAMLHHRLPYKD
jgi:hypothetical protein